METYGIRQIMTRGNNHPVVGRSVNLDAAKEQADEQAAKNELTPGYGPVIVERLSDGERVYTGDAENVSDDKPPEETDDSSTDDTCSYCGQSRSTSGHPVPGVCDNI